MTTISTALVVYDPSEGSAQIFHKDLSKKEFQSIKEKEGRNVDEQVYASWNPPTETSLFPDGWVPKEWVYVLADESEDDDFFVSSGEEDKPTVEEDDGSYDEDEDEEDEEVVEDEVVEDEGESEEDEDDIDVVEEDESE